MTWGRPPNGQGLGAPPTLHDLQMDKGLGPSPQLANGQGFSPPAPPPPQGFRPPPPPNPSRLANGQGFRPPPTPPPTLHDLQMDKGLGPPQPFTTCKGTRVAGPSTLHDLGAWGPPPTLQMDKGWGRLPNRQGLGAPPTPICKRTRVGAQPFTTPPPTLNDLQMDKGWGPQPFTTCEWTRVGGPPTLHDLQTSNFVWTSIGASKPSNA